MGFKGIRFHSNKMTFFLPEAILLWFSHPSTGCVFVYNWGYPVNIYINNEGALVGFLNQTFLSVKCTTLNKFSVFVEHKLQG